MMIFIMLVVLIIIGLVSISVYFFNFSQNVEFSRKKYFKAKKSLSLSSDDDYKWFETTNYKSVFIEAFDNLKLHAYVIDNKKNNWVIIVHGFTNNGLEMLNPAKHFFDLGFNVLLIDQRAHGLSAGKYTSMGYIESKDISSWIEFLIKKYGNINIGLYGISMGARTVMLSTSLNLPKNVKFAIEDCGFVSLYKQFYNQLKYLKFYPRPIIYGAHFISMLLLNFDLYKVDELKLLEKGKIPMLFIHGEKDKLVPVDNLIQAYEHYNGKKDKLMVKNSKHMQSCLVDSGLYWQKIKSFLKNYINN